MNWHSEALLFFLIIMTLGSSINPVRFGADATPEKSMVQNMAASISNSASLHPNAGCFGVSTRIPGVEGAFAVIATDSLGGVYIAYQSVRIDNGSDAYVHIYFAYSYDYGESWSESFRIDDVGDFSVQCDSPSIAVDPLTGHIFVAWKDNRTGTGKAYVDKSVDRGVSFGSDVTVYSSSFDTVAMGMPYTVNVKVGANGNVYVAWVAFYSDSYLDCDVLLARSTDGGSVFSPPTVVNPAEGTARLTHPWIAVDAGSVLFVAYSRRNSTFSGVYLARSLNEGSLFETPAKVNDDSTRRYRGGTQVTVSPDGRIHVTWTDGRAGDGTQYLDIYYAASLDGGLSFQPNIRVNDDNERSPSGQDFTRGAHGTPSIATDSSSRVHMVWEDFRNFVNETSYCRDIYYASSKEGALFSKNLRANSIDAYADSVNCADPNMALDAQDNLFIVYSDAPSGDNSHPQIYFIFAQYSSWEWTKLLDWKHYHNYTEITAISFALNETYSDIVDVFSIGKSWQNRDIYCIRLTNESRTDPKPRVFFVGYHHAREPITAELALYFAVEAATAFGSNATITHMLDYCEIYIVIALNVDSFDLVRDNEWQRKNAHPFDEDDDGSFDEDPPEDEDGDGYIEDLIQWNGYQWAFVRWEGIDSDLDGLLNEDWVGGVDLNRNYGYQWNATCDSGNPDPQAEDFRGTGPFSEPETQALRDFAMSKGFRYAVSLHSGADVILYPWGYTGTQAPHSAVFTEVAANLSALIGSPYEPSGQMYTTSGVWDDWMYGNRSTLAFTCEIYQNSSAWQYEPGPYPDSLWERGITQAFNPEPENIETTVQRWLPIFTYITERATRLLGETNGDGKIDLKDVFRVGKAFGSIPGQPKWDAFCDINVDFKADLKDYFATSKNFGKTDP